MLLSKEGNIEIAATELHAKVAQNKPLIFVVCSDYIDKS